MAWRHEAFVPLEGSVFPGYVAGGMLAEHLRVAEHANKAVVLPYSRGIDGEVVDEKLQEFCGEGLSLQQYFKIPLNEISTYTVPNCGGDEQITVLLLIYVAATDVRVPNLQTRREDAQKLRPVKVTTIPPVASPLVGKTAFTIAGM